MKDDLQVVSQLSSFVEHSEYESLFSKKKQKFNFKYFFYLSLPLLFVFLYNSYIY